MSTTDLDWVLIRDRRQSKRDIADSMGRCAEVRRKISVVNINFLQRTGNEEETLFSSSSVLKHSKVSYPRKQNGATTIVAQFYVT